MTTAREPRVVGADRVGYPGVYYRHGLFLSESSDEVARERKIDWADPGIDGISDAVGERYKERLQSFADEALSHTKAETHRRRPDETGGPGIEFDLVTILVGATGLGGGLLVWKEVAQDVRSLARKLRRQSGDHVVVNDVAAMVLAVDAVALPGTQADIEVAFVSPLRLPSDEDSGAARGYLVGLRVEDAVKVVAIDPDGHAAGVSELTGIERERLGL